MNHEGTEGIASGFTTYETEDGKYIWEWALNA